MKTDSPKPVTQIITPVTVPNSKNANRDMDDPKENQPSEDRQVAALTNGERGNDDPAEDKYESEMGEWEGVDFPDYGDV